MLLGCHHTDFRPTFLVFPMKYAHVRNIFPILNHSPLEILNATKASALEFLGFNNPCFYPFIKKEIAKQMGTWWYCFSTILYVVLAIVSLMYYSHWTATPYHLANINDAKIIKVPFIQRFEYIIIFLWYLIILPNICLTIWSSCCISKSLFIYHLKLHYHFYRCYIYFILVFHKP